MTTLHTLIARVRRRWFVQVLLCHAGRAFAWASLPVFLALAVDYALAPDGAALIALAIVTTAAAVALGSLAIGRMQRRPDDRHVARFIEERAAGSPGVVPLDDALVSAVDVAQRPDRDAGFAAMIVAGAVERIRGMEPSRVIPAAALGRAATQGLAGAALLALALVSGAPPLARAIDTARVRLFPESIAVHVLPGDTRVPAGTPLQVRAIVRDGRGPIARVAPSLTVSAAGEERTVRMTPSGEGFEFTFDSVDRSFAYRITAGTAASRQYTVTALFAPRVRQIELRYAYPAFTGLPVRDEEDGGDIYAPPGTRVRVRIHTDTPAAEGHLAMGRTGAAPLPLRLAGDRVLEGDLVLEADDSYRVALSNADGLQSRGDTEYFIRLMDDRPPDVRILRPSSDQSITPLEEVAIEARADDDYGIAGFDLVYSVGGGGEVVVPFDRVTGTDIQKVGVRLLAAEDLGVKPGDVIAYYARARDVARGSPSTRRESDIFFLEVKPFSEEFVQAQSQAGGSGASSQQIESLIAAQKEIISATWNIERRSPGGVSAGDLQQVAAAQAELRQRVEQMAARSMRGRGGIRPPAERPAAQRVAQPGRQSSADPIAAAIEAMARALQQLESKKTKDAIPHEMAALNRLLEAQAEVRRREVSRQSNSSGSGGSNRSGQDLSALFDKELQRQQRTNYESRSQLEERPDRGQSNDSAADRIRDLARRQEELGRQQRELAAGGLSAEELQRRLERLTREQTELRERAEALTREMAQQGQQQGQRSGEQPGQRSGEQQGRGQGGRQGPGQAGQSPAPPEGQASSGMRGVSEQMRSAASDLQRQDAAAAAQNAERAAEQLRRIEQQMRGGSTGTPGKAAGELQMEAQQIAQEQRRIAAEAERLDKGAGAGADARRRLAGEKELLAGRVDELQRAVRQQAQRGQKMPGGNGMEAAAAELERQQIGQRMRESAEQLRTPGAAGTPAAAPKLAGQAEQQIARALDRVVEKLGGGSADARQLTGQLEQTREIRDRLNRMEQQMREAESNARGSQPGRQAGDGRQGAPGAAGRGQDGELQRLQQAYQQELARAREALGRLGSASQSAGGGATPEQHEFSRSAPGTEASKQDRSGWAALRRDVDTALEKHDAAISQRLAQRLSEDRLSAGGSERVPDQYRVRIARYYESLAKAKK